MTHNGITTEKVEYKIGIKKIIDPGTNSVTLSFEGNWGPIVSGENEQEAFAKLKEALKVISAVRSVLNIENSLNTGGITKEKLKDETTKKYKITDDCSAVELV